MHVEDLEVMMCTKTLENDRSPSRTLSDLLKKAMITPRFHTGQVHLILMAPHDYICILSTCTQCIHLYGLYVYTIIYMPYHDLPSSCSMSKVS